MKSKTIADDETTQNLPFGAPAIPNQLMPISAIDGWKLDAAASRAIDEIVRDSSVDPVGPEFMAPPARGKPAGIS